MLPFPVAPAAGNPRALVVRDAADAAGWDRYVERHPEATGYHLWAWRDIIRSAFGHRCEYLVALRDGAPCGVLPLVAVTSWLFGRSMVSLPFLNHGGVLGDDPAAEAALLEDAVQRARAARVAFIELRHDQPHFPHLPCRRHKAAMRLPLAADPDAIWTGLDRKVRNQVRKAEKSGLVAAIGGAGLLDEFYRVFAVTMRDLGTPVYARRFFAEILDRLAGRTRVYVVRLGDRVIAAGMSFAYRTTVEMHWAGSLRAFHSMCPNNLLYWTAIRQAALDGYRTFDFGRSTPGEGTFQFKRQWGAEPHHLAWEYRLITAAAIPDRSPKNPKFRAAVETWKRLPLPIANAVGPRIVRGIA